MVDFKEFKGTAKRIDDIDLPRIGSRIKVGEDEVHAFIEAETRGSGFDPQGRPKILFERHKFYEYLPESKRAEAVKAGLANKRPGGYGKESAQYGKLEQARKIDEKAALYACSWGLAQIMGFNHVAAGYKTVEDMIFDFMEDEENHLEAAINFIIFNNLDDELRDHNWAGFAKGYNGTNYRINKYDEKLASAYAKWAKIRDTPYDPTDVSKAPIDEEITDTEIIRKAQILLRDKGYPEVGNVDGVMGNRTRDAIIVFQRNNNLTLDGKLTDQLLIALIKSPVRENAASRTTATKEDLKEAPSIKQANWFMNIGKALLAFTGVGAMLEGGTEVVDVVASVNKVNALWGAVSTVSPWLIGIGAGSVILYFGSSFIKEQVQAYREGRHV